MDSRFDLSFEGASPVLREFLARKGVTQGAFLLAGIAGSRRAYYRLDRLDRLDRLERFGDAGGEEGTSASYILLVSPLDDADFGRFLRITQFYRMLRFPVPRVYCIDDAAHQVLLEDLGTQRLYDVLAADRRQGLEAYRKTLDVLADLQNRCHPFHAECPDIDSRVFDRAQLLWETSYYRENYLEGHRGLTVKGVDGSDGADGTGGIAFGLQAIFDALAARVDAHEKSILHRDFQSQNIMVKPDGTVHVIDYQGSRMGSAYYDLASLLLDPYVGLADAEIEELLRYFHEVQEDAPDFAAFRAAFLEAGLQRVMQALGAYCFLSRVKGIAEFAGHIPAGEARLRWLIRETGGEWAKVLP